MNFNQLFFVYADNLYHNSDSKTLKFRMIIVIVVIIIAYIILIVLRK